MRILNSLLDHLRLKDVYIVGNSFGGFLAWNYSIHEATKIRKMVLQDAAGFNTRYRDISDIGFMLATYEYSRKLTYSVTPKSLIKSSLRNATTSRFKITDDMVNRYYDLLVREGNRKAFSNILRKLIFTEKDNTQLIRQVSVPTLIQWGEEDALINIDCAFQFHRAIDGSRLITYSDTGHLPMEECAEQSALDAKNFFNDN